MADAVSTFTVRGRADVEDAVRGLNRLGDEVKDAGDASQSFESQMKGMSVGLINAEDATTLLTTATNSLGTALSGADSELRNMGGAAAVAATGVNNLNDNVQLLTNLQIAETVKSIGGTFMELSGHLRAVEDAFRATADTIADPFIARMAEGGATVASFGAIAFEVAGTGLELGAAVAQVVSILPQLGAITAAVSAGFVAAKAAIMAFAASITVATAGFAAAAVAIGYGIERFIAYRQQVALTNEAIAESARQTQRNAATLRDYFTTFSQQTDQAEIMAGIQEQSAQAQNDANTYIARTIALRYEELGLLDDEIAGLERTELLNDAKMAFMETRRAQLQIETMLMQGLSQEEVASALNLQFMGEAASLTTDQLRTWLATLPAINEELQRTEETSRTVFELYSRLVSSFIQGTEPTGITSEATDSVVSYAAAIDYAAIANEKLKEATEAAYEAVKRQSDLSASFVIDPKAQEDLSSTKLADTVAADGAAALAAAIEAKGKISAAMQPVEGEGDGFGFAAALGKDYDASKEAFGALGGVADGFGSSLSSSFGAALGSTENFGKAFRKALGQSLVGQGISEILTGISNMIPFGPQFNPAAGTARLAAGGAMLLAGKAMGGSGSAPGGAGGGGGGGRSVGESSGMTPMAQPQRQGPTNLIDYSGVTIVTNDTDSMRTLIDRQARTATAGAGSRV
jgi:hypothetical protein